MNKHTKELIRLTKMKAQLQSGDIGRIASDTGYSRMSVNRAFNGDLSEGSKIIIACAEMLLQERKEQQQEWLSAKQ